MQVSRGKYFALNDACVVAERDKLHLLTIDLMMRAVGDDEPAGDDALAGVMGEISNGAIRLPRDARELIERMQPATLQNTICRV